MLNGWTQYLSSTCREAKLGAWFYGIREKLCDKFRIGAIDWPGAGVAKEERGL